MILDVLQAPHPLLKKPAREAAHDELDLQPLITHMIETMNHYPRCVGLAAPQVNQSWRVIVVDASRVNKPGSQHGLVTMINPVIVQRGNPRLLREGCLSVPGYTGNVLRDELVEIHGYDRQGRAIQIKAEGFEAVVFQHEIDHLDGKLFLDRVASLETDVFRRKTFG